jgi:formylmethanofuran dehydrogenase subunit B
VADFGPVTCAGCGLLCDDVIIDASSDRMRLQPDCALGVQWFSDRIHRRDAAPATINGQPTDVESALARAAELLREARRPLVHGFEGATVEDARAALALADRLGALVVTRRAADGWPGAPAVPLRGASSATLGEIRDRSRLVVIWREDPETTHPRLLDRLGFGGTPSRVGPERTLVVVDDRDTATARRADTRLRCQRDHDLDALTSLHVLQRGLALPPRDVVADVTGLMNRLTAVPHATFVYGPGLTGGAGGQRRALALHELVRALNHERHVVTLELPAAAGTRSADDVVAWQTGYSGAVDLAGGHPESLSATHRTGDDEDVDVVLSIEAAPARAAGGAEIGLGTLPPGHDVAVSIRTAASGVSATGTAHRLDGVPVALQAPLPDDAPPAAALLARLLEEVTR